MGSVMRPSTGMLLKPMLRMIRASEAEVRRTVGDLPLARVREILEALIREHAPGPERPWWEAMRDENDDEGDVPRTDDASDR
jgi:hypothetical protein